VGVGGNKQVTLLSSEESLKSKNDFGFGYGCFFFRYLKEEIPKNLEREWGFLHKKREKQSLRSTWKEMDAETSNYGCSTKSIERWT
jgi:hypothetical protein